MPQIQFDFNPLKAGLEPVDNSLDILHYFNESYDQWQSRSVQYHYGPHADRRMEILPDRQTLQFCRLRMDRPTHLGSQRIQVNQTVNDGHNYVSDWKRMRINFEAPTSSWMALGEWWTGADWNGDTLAGRMTMNYGKTAEGKNILIFSFTYKSVSESLWNTAWTETIEVPVGEWFNLWCTLTLNQGGQTSRFAVAIQRPNQMMNREIEVFDYLNHPDSPTVMPFITINPMMLYTSSDMVASAEARGFPLTVDYRNVHVQTEQRGV